MTASLAAGFESLPVEHQAVLLLAQEQNGLTVTPLEELHGGRSGAFIYLVSVSDLDSNRVEHHILKLNQKRMWPVDEIDRHNLAYDEAPAEFAQSHMPRLAFEPVRGEDSEAIFYTIAGASLHNYRTLDSYETQNQLEAIFEMAGEALLADWNAEASFEQARTPQSLLAKWSSYRLEPGSRTEEFLANVAGVAPNSPGLLINGGVLPNPFAYARNAELWGSVRQMDVLIGLQHGDLNMRNILVKFSSEGAVIEGYYIIDFAMFKDQMPLLFDLSYLELSYLISYLPGIPFRRWVDLALGHAVADIPDPNQAPAELAGASAVIGAGRKYFANWLESTHPSLVDDMWGQYWLACVATGLNFCNKSALSDEGRLAALIYAAAHLKRYATKFGLPMPEEATYLYSADLTPATVEASRSLGVRLPTRTVTILATKLNPPRVRADIIDRPRLTQRLDRSLDRKLTLLSAPAGYGKTTLLSAWIEETHPRLGWVSLDHRDNDPTRFWAYFISAVESVHSDIGSSALSQLQSPQQPNIEAVLSALINPISDMSEPFVIVLDDYHVIEESAIHEGMAFLIEHLPPQMHLLVSTRADPALPIAALRAKDELNELRAKDLRATREESGIFLEKVMGLSLSPSDIATLEERTEGWIAGLQLAGLSLQGRDDISEFLEAFAGSHRYVLDYLAEEVLYRQQEEDQSFLLQTSILERLSGSLCDAVTRHDNSQAILEQFETANLFIISLDDERHWYRYHHLFADFLRNRLVQQRPDKVFELHLRACDWYEQHGFVAEALDHALTAHDYERAADLAELAVGQKIMSGELTTVSHWLEQLPDSILSVRPRLILDQAWTLLWTGQREAAEKRLDVLLESENAESVEIAGEMFAMRATIAYYRREIKQTLEMTKKALEKLPADELFLRSILVLAEGRAYLWKGDLEAADLSYAEAQSISQSSRVPLIGLLVLGYRIHLRQISGRLRQAAELFEETIRFADEHKVRSLPAVGAALVRMGDVHREWNEFEVAAKSLAEGLALCERWGAMVDHTVEGYISLARVRQSQMDFDGAREMLAQAERVGGEFDVPNLSGLLESWRVRLHLAEGDLAVDEPWANSLLSEPQVVEGQGPTLVYEAQQTTLARWLLTNNRPAEALAILESLLEEADSANRKATVLEVLTLQSLALRKQSKSREAIAALRKALKLAEPEGYVRMFVDEGESMEILLKEAASEGIALDYVRTLLEVYEAPSR